MSRQILAIDIRNDQISGLLLNAGLKTNTIMACTHISLTDLETGEDGNPLQTAFGQMLQQMDATKADVIVSLPPDGVIFRSLLVPFKENSKIRQVLPFELEPSLPLDIDRLKIGFQRQAAGDETEVLTAAIDKITLADRLDSMSSVGLTPHLVVPGGIPLARMISTVEPDMARNALVLDVDTHATTMIVLESGRIKVVRSIPFGAESGPAVESLALRIRQTLTARSERHGTAQLTEKAYLSGPGLQPPENANRIAGALDIPVETLDILQLVPHAEMQSPVDWNPETMNQALALSFLEAENIDCPSFHRVSSPFRNYWSAYRPYILGPAVLAVLVIFIGLGGVLFDSFFLKNKVDALDSQIVEVFKSTFPDTRLSAAPLNQMKSKIKEVQKGASGPATGGTNMRSIDILLQISRQIPASVKVVFNQMIVGSNTVTVSGETADFNTVDDIKNRLEQSEMFNQVTIASANMSKSGENVRFKLKIDL